MYNNNHQQVTVVVQATWEAVVMQIVTQATWEVVVKQVVVQATWEVVVMQVVAQVVEGYLDILEE